MADAVFKYRLQPLLDGKIELKEEAERKLAGRQKEVRAEEERLSQLEARARGLGETKESFRRAPRTGLTGRGAEFRRDYLRGLDQDIEDARNACFSQRLALEEAQERLAEARRELAERTREVEILEKHRERLERRFRREIERKEALEQDEIGNMLYASRRRAT